MPKRERQLRLLDFRSGRSPILTAVDILNEGVDVPDVNIIAFARVTHSRRIFVQQLGRGLRLREGKERVLALDFVSDMRRVAALLTSTQALEARRDRSAARMPAAAHRFYDVRAESLLEQWILDAADLETANDEARLQFLDPECCPHEPPTSFFRRDAGADSRSPLRRGRPAGWETLSPPARTRTLYEWIIDGRIGGVLTQFMSAGPGPLLDQGRAEKEYARRGEAPAATRQVRPVGTSADVIRHALGNNAEIDGLVGTKPLHCLARKAEGAGAVYVTWGDSRNFRNLLWAALRASVLDNLDAHIVVLEPRGLTTPKRRMQAPASVRPDRCSVELHHMREILGTPMGCARHEPRSLCDQQDHAAASRTAIHGLRSRCAASSTGEVSAIVSELTLPGKPDLVFPGARIALFVDGDYWHGNAWRDRGFESFKAYYGRGENERSGSTRRSAATWTVTRQ